MELTNEQRLATVLTGNSLLVSAAAGSGKTSVLTERVVKKLTAEKNPVPADRLMILTYTNAAAAEMRKRIADSLRELCMTKKDDANIKKQLVLLPAAKICTIHAACLDIIKNNFQLCNIDPQFTIAEENKLALMRSEELDDFIEYIYEEAEQNSDVREVADYFSKGKDDGDITRAIDSGSEFLAKQPYENEFIESACSVLPEKIIDDITEYALCELNDICKRYSALKDAAFEFEVLDEFYSNEQSFALSVYNFLAEGDFDSAFESLSGYKFKNHPSKPKPVDADAWALLRDTRTELKERLQKIASNFIYSDKNTIIEDRKWELSFLRKYYALCSQFNKILFEKRKKQRIMSFDDIEKYALYLLIEKIEDGKPVKTALAQELSDNIDEIIVDECQDCNKTQDLIFTALSKNSENIFMVGDVKQSIYRFRGAQPEIFLEKQLSSVSVHKDVPLTMPSRVDLSKNFRSHARVLDFANSVFERIMTEKFGGIDYNDGHRLFVNENRAKTDCAAAETYLLVSGNDKDDPADKLSKTEKEAEFVAEKILSLVGKEKMYDVKKGEERFITFADISVLMRAPKTDGAVFETVFERKGIPYINNNPSENYLDTSEIRAVLAFLQVIDNPCNDIPLVCLMYSDFFSFSAEKLAKIRSKKRKANFYDAVKEYAKEDKQTSDFVETVTNLRALSMTTDVYGIISAVYETTGILLKLSAKEGGANAAANLSLLLDYAENFESVRYRGLFAFINFIAKLSEKKETIPAARLKKSDNCVSILSIHRSKGLEYPVVFLVGSGNTLRSVEMNTVVSDKDLGAGLYIRDSIKHRDFSAASRNLISAKEREMDLSEYMRLLYVALTRPISHVYVTGIMGVNAVESAVRCAYLANETPEKYDIMQQPSFMKWLLFYFINTQSAKKLCAFAGVPQDKCINETDFKFEYVNVSEMENSPQKQTEVSKDNEFVTKQRATELISRTYDFEADTFVPSKLSVSEIKNMKKAPTGKSVKSRGFKKLPRFLEKVSGVDKGNATHRFLQFCDFGAVKDAESFEAEKKRLVDFEFITEKEAEFVECDKIIRFLSSDIMKNLADYQMLKEQRFLFTLPAHEVMETQSAEPVMIQGIIDLLYVKDANAVILDYKTDKVTDASTLVDRYKAQLDMYEKAVYLTKGLKTVKKYIYSFELECFAEV